MNDECKKHARQLLTAVALLNFINDTPRIADPIRYGTAVEDALNAPSTGYRLADLSVARLSSTFQTTR